MHRVAPGATEEEEEEEEEATEEEPFSSLQGVAPSTWGSLTGEAQEEEEGEATEEEVEDKLVAAMKSHPTVLSESAHECLAVIVFLIFSAFESLSI